MPRRPRLPFSLPLLAAAAGLASVASAAVPPPPPADPLVRLDRGPGPSFHPAIALDAAGAPRMLWHRFPSAGAARLEGADAGDLRAQGASGAALPALEPVLASDPVSGEVHLVYRSGSAPSDVRWCRLAGGRWSAPRNLSRTPGDSRHAALLARGGELTVVWEDATGGPVRLWFARSRDGGARWSRARPVDHARAQRSFSGHHALAAGADRSVHLVWEDGGDGGSEVYWSELRAGSWRPAVNVSSSPEEFSGEPHVAATRGGIDVAWVEQDAWDATRFGVARARRDPSGSWTRHDPPRGGSPVTYRPRLLAVAGGGPPDLLWESPGPDGRVLELAGPGATAPRTVSAGARDARRAAAAYDERGTLHLVFDAAVAGGGRAIYYRRVE